MRVLKTNLDGVLEVFPEKFEDHRGIYIETYNRDNYKEAGIDIEFIQDDYSKSHRNVLRGLHGDSKTWKLVSCSYGELFLAVVDARKSSPDFGKNQTFILDSKSCNQVLIPPGFANGHYIISDIGIFNYKQSTNYDPESQFSYKYDEPKFSIEWPFTKEPILSTRDLQAPFIS